MHCEQVLTLFEWLFPSPGLPVCENWQGIVNILGQETADLPVVFTRYCK